MRKSTGYPPLQSIRGYKEVTPDAGGEYTLPTINVFIISPAMRLHADGGHLDLAAGGAIVTDAFRIGIKSYLPYIAEHWVKGRGSIGKPQTGADQSLLDQPLCCLIHSIEVLLLANRFQLIGNIAG